MTNFWGGKVVLITGGTGSLGQALTEKLLDRGEVRAVRVFSRDEQKQAALGARLNSDRLRLLLGDVRDLPRLRRAFEGVDVVIHAAALKRVDAIAYDPMETIKTNVIGAMNVVEAALDAGVGRVLGISTDKGCRPSNLYGATKLVMERLFMHSSAYAGVRSIRFACVRYGNVLGSRGSVLHVWREQFQRGGHVTLTDSAATRFWITLDQAAAFVLGAVEAMNGGEIFVPSLPSARVIDLLHEAVGPVPYVVTGFRPGGEKIDEDLLSTHEASRVRYRNGKDRADGWVIDPEEAVPVSGNGYIGEGYALTSGDAPMERVELHRLLEETGLLLE